MTEGNDHDLGPLPQADPQSQLAREAIDVLRSALPKKQFLFRAERHDDYGVDGTLEILVHDKATNLRAHVQVRARSGTKCGVDGSVSLQVKTTNLNYLLNGPAPLYVLYRPEQKELRYAFARDEFRRIEAQNPEWRTQQTVVIQMKNILREPDLREIHERIIAESKFNRSLHDTITQAVPGKIAIQVDVSTLSILTAEQSFEFLLQYGAQLTAVGFANKVIEAARILRDDHRKHGRIQLALGYAFYSRGDYLKADGYLADAALAVSDLDEENRAFLYFLIDACDYFTGRVTRDQFIKKMSEWPRMAPPAMAVQYDLLTLREQWRIERDRESRDRIRGEIIRIANNASIDPGIPPQVRARVRLTLLECEVEQLSLHLGKAMMLAANEGPRKTRNLSDVADSRSDLARLTRQWTTWESTAQELMKEATDGANERFYLEVDYVVLLGRLGLLKQWTYARLMNDKPVGHHALFDTICKQSDRVSELAMRCANSEYRIRAQLIKAQVLDLKGETDLAEIIARNALEVAVALRLAAAEATARSFLAGEDTLRAIISQVEKIRATRPEQLMLAVPDEELERYAREECSILGIPEDRHRVIYHEMLCFRQLAEEQEKWCRYLGLLENRSHAQSKETHYRHVPPKVCTCSLLGVQSIIESEEFETLVAAFKAAHCVDCKDRVPGGAD